MKDKQKSKKHRSNTYWEDLAVIRTFMLHIRYTNQPVKPDSNG